MVEEELGDDTLEDTGVAATQRDSGLVTLGNRCMVPMLSANAQC